VAQSYVCFNFDEKMGWALFWATFSHMHPVTLPPVVTEPDEFRPDY
jgi:hypothetical protein